MPINQLHRTTHAGSKVGEQMPETAGTKLLARTQNILRDPLTFVLLVWAVMFVVAGVCWILYV